ncbi:hypothetical protein PanWU01x14_151660 [Parasponia andersonii]|uniref:Uncharacterized protein n=1 Tax=Parasponia andersonii TaxID=3476 RepID=A0A2P5CHP6_PARAD|nr:hypothetical protein PanWU01x14_151660 [Parasponia andersonii]
MSKMRSVQKPPLAKSPRRLRPRRGLQQNPIQTPMGYLTKSLKPNRMPETEESEVRPEYHTISCELRALAKKVRDELGNEEIPNAGFSECVRASSSPLFERGRFYEEYSARRNERLRRKKGQTGEEGKSAYNLGVNVESVKRSSSKKLGSLRKSISAAYSVEKTSETPRYMLRSMSKDNKKPPLPLYSEKSARSSKSSKA